MALDKYQELDPQQPFAFEIDIYGGTGSGSDTTILPSETPVKWQPSIIETIAAPAPDTTVVLPPAQPTSQVATTSTPAIISAIQGAVNGIANALNVGSPATPPFVPSSQAAQAAKDATVIAKQKTLITTGLVMIVIAVLAYFAFKKK